MDLGTALILLTSLFFLMVLVNWVVRPFVKGGANIRGGNFTDIGDSPEWQSFVGRRKEIEEDPLLDDASRESLLGAWREMAEASKNLVDRKYEASRIAALDLFSRNSNWLGLPILGFAVVTTYLIGGFNESSFVMPKAADRSIASLPGARNLVTSGGHPGDGVPIQERLQGLEERLKENPGDVNGWVLLARTQASVSDYLASATSLRKALTLVPGHPGLLADLADMVAMSNGRSMEGEPTELVARALANDPAHEKALALAATAAEQAGNSERAQAYWQRLAQVQQQKLAQSASSSNPNQVSGAGNGGDYRVSGAAALTSEQLEALPQQSVMFVFLKEQQGPGMPTAVLKIPKSDLRVGNNQFDLTQANLIRKEQAESLPDQMFMQVRVAASGSVQPSPKDLVSSWVQVDFKNGQALNEPLALQSPSSSQ